MNPVSVISSIAVLVILPVIAGSGIVFAGDTVKRRLPGKLIFSWLFGQLVFWCIFQFIAVFNIIRSNSYETIKKEYLLAAGAVCFISAAVFVVSLLTEKGRVKRGNAGSGIVPGNALSDRAADGKIIAGMSGVMNTPEKIVAVIAVAGIVVQVVLQIVLAYMEVDDSYYVSEAAGAIGADMLYYRIPYTGITTGFDARHALAPFPIWLALISDICGMRVVSMAHVMIPALFLPLTYLVYGLFGYILLEKNRRFLPVFMLFTELLVTFGFYSYMTPEKFFITRLREGKATIASLIIPGIIMCLYMIIRSLGDDKERRVKAYILLFILNVSGCLCSTLGALVCAMPVAICGILSAIMYKKIRHLIPLAICCLPCLLFAIMYLKL